VFYQFMFFLFRLGSLMQLVLVTIVCLCVRREKILKLCIFSVPFSGNMRMFVNVNLINVLYRLFQMVYVCSHATEFSPDSPGGLRSYHHFGFCIVPECCILLKLS
jgi:hypothetical protein